MRKVYFFIIALVLCSVCYYPEEESTLYAVNDNFILAADSIRLQTECVVLCI